MNIPLDQKMHKITLYFKYRPHYSCGKIDQNPHDTILSFSISFLNSNITTGKGCFYKFETFREITGCFVATWLYQLYILLYFTFLSFSTLKLLISKIFNILLELFVSLVLSRTYPDLWKKALIRAINKVKQPKNCSEYKPINILCVIGKMLDKLIFYHLNGFINKHNILRTYQSGYKSNNSIKTDLIKIMDGIREAMVLRTSTVLRHIGLTESVFALFEQYLTNLYQKVYISEGLTSNWTNLISGIPQGSLINPLIGFSFHYLHQ